MSDCDRDGHMFGSGGYCHVCAVLAPPIPEFLRRQNADARDELTAANARIAELEALLGGGYREHRRLSTIAITKDLYGHLEADHLEAAVKLLDDV